MIAEKEEIFSACLSNTSNILSLRTMGRWQRHDNSESWVFYIFGSGLDIFFCLALFTVESLITWLPLHPNLF